MIKLIAFDLDNTLAPQGKPIKPNVVKMLKEIEKSGVLIAIISGKTAFYLTGFFRQVDLEKTIVVGENGAEVAIGTQLPPEQYYLIDISKKKQNQLAWIENKIRKMFNNQLWWQNNRFGIAPFPRNEQEFEMISNFIKKHRNKFKGLTVYRHPDCFDIVPSEISKKQGFINLLNILNIKPTETIAVGDGVNDYPMFEVAKYSVGVNVKDSNKVNANFKTIEEAITHIIETKLKPKTTTRKTKSK